MSARQLTDEEVADALRSIPDPCSLAHRRPTDIVSFGLVKEAQGGERPHVTLRLTEPTCLYRAWFVRKVRDLLGSEADIDFAPADDIWGPEE